MSAKSKRNVFIILTIVLLGSLAGAGILINGNGEATNDIRVYWGGSDKLSVVPFETDGEGEESGMLCFLLPFPAEKDVYRIDFPKDDRVYIDSNEYSSGDTLLPYVSGYKHRLEIIRKWRTESRDVVFYYADDIPVVSVDMEDGAFEKMSADSMHLSKKNSTISIVDPKTHLNTSEYCYIGGHGGSSWECRL